MGEQILGRTVYTPLGAGRVVYALGDGSFVVEFPHGGGQIVPAEELLRYYIQPAGRKRPMGGERVQAGDRR